MEIETAFFHNRFAATRRSARRQRWDATADGSMLHKRGYKNRKPAPKPAPKRGFRKVVQNL